MSNDVDTLIAAVERQRKRMQLPRALLNGTESMRSAGETFLPKFAAESFEAYRVRLGRSFLHPGFATTLAHLSGRVFEKPPTIDDDMPSVLRDYAEDIDLRGNNLTIFAKTWFDAALTDGLAHVMVAYPATPENATLADARDQKWRPYLRLIEHGSVVGFRVENRSGVEVLTQLRLFETATVPHGEFGERVVERIRVYSPERWSVLERAATDQAWSEVDSGTFRPPGIRLVTLYLGKRLAPFEASAPLTELAWMNLLHWQSSSDQRNILTVARCPMLVATGAADDELGDVFAVSPNRMLRLASPDAAVKFIEHTGAAIEAGERDLAKIEEAMAAQGAAFLVRPTGGATATARALDSAESAAPLAMMALALQDAMEQAFVLIGEMVPGGAVKAGSIAVHRDFKVMASDADLTALMKARAMGDISREAMLAEFVRRGLLPDDFDAAADGAKSATETPDLDLAAD